MEAARLVVAYEPVWAIGTGRTATPADVAKVHAEIRRLLVGLVGEGAEKVRILYGGSVKPDNARELLRSEEHTSELQSLMRISYAVFCLKKKKEHNKTQQKTQVHINKNTTKKHT